jgi:K+-transporting ATPase ATPase C chain
MLSELKPALRLLLVMAVLTGLAYPLAITGLAELLFPEQAHGSLIDIDGKVIGSSVVGQRFQEPRYFQSRPSAAGTDGYDGSQSGASNLATTSKRLIADITSRAAAARAEAGPTPPPVPIDLVTASASGLDPDLSPAAALYQIPRVARVRGLSEEKLRFLVSAVTEKRDFGVLGEPRVNLLKLNLALDVMVKDAEDSK